MRITLLLALFLFAGTLGFAATLWATPRLAMWQAIERILQIDRRIRPHLWVVAPPASAESRQGIMPAPELASTICVLDVSGGPVRIRMAPFDDHASLAVYSMASDLVFAVNDRAGPAAWQGYLVYRAGEPPPPLGPEDKAAIALPNDRGLALIRRLAPDEAARAVTLRAIPNDVCMPVTLIERRRQLDRRDAAQGTP